MRVLIKTIKGEQFEVSDADENMKVINFITQVIDFKQKIQEIKGYDKSL